eukprot:GEZU01018611.1.p1 GENE.GEZU01018611.1~~GEZU01018611.1.p1  ORF type:complete len:407 (-),score=76.39 GEZU01018611.1:123-1343(-)
MFLRRANTQNLFPKFAIFGTRRSGYTNAKSTAACLIGHDHRSRAALLYHQSQQIMSSIIGTSSGSSTYNNHLATRSFATSTSTTKRKVLVTRKIPQQAIDMIKAHCDVIQWESEEPIPREELKKNIRNVDGMYCLLTDKVDRELLDEAQQLKVVSTMSVGYDHIDVKECAKRNIPVGYTPGILTETTSELAVALLLATARRLTEAADAVKNGEWSTWKPEWMLGVDVSGSTIGIVGLGRIGDSFARRMRFGFGCKILYWTPSGPKPDTTKDYDGEYVPSFDELLARSDFVVPHCALTPDTRHLFNGRAFGLMKKSAIFINTTRGGVVDQDALYDALKSGQIAAAGLDVCDPEPLPKDHKLLSLKNCVVLPHIGSATVATRTKMATMAAENVIAGVMGKPLPYRLQC